MLTIFTPTYNRGKLIYKLYYSLLEQTSKNFEWIVINDGGDDETEFFFHNLLLTTHDFPIHYKKINHGGKHRAINHAVKMAKHEAFMIVDDDDYLIPTAVEYIEKWFKTIEKNESFAGVSGLRGFSASQGVGDTGIDNGKQYIDGNVFQLKEMGFSGDMAEIYRTDILRKYPFPEYENEVFISENAVWFQIALAGYQVRWYKKIIYICKYLPNGLTCNMRRNLKKNPIGWLKCIHLKASITDKHMIQQEYLKWYLLAYHENIKTSVERYFGKDILKNIESQFYYVVDCTKRYINSNGIKNIAVYGIGTYGHMFLKISSVLDVTLEFAIDRIKRNFGSINVYRPDEEYMYVDAIFITMSEKDEAVLCLLERKAKCVIFWRDLWD